MNVRHYYNFMAKKRELPKECEDNMAAVQEALDAIGGKWKIKILSMLYSGDCFFMELQRSVAGVGAKMLSKELKDLEENGLVKRIICDTRPITVRYELTAYGRTLKDIIENMQEWGKMHIRKKTVSSV